MSYYFSKVLELPFEEAAVKVTDALKNEGFGVISEINMHEKFKEKLGADFKKYRILGACNPALAFKAVSMEDKIGTMLPCNIVVIDQGNGKTEVSAVNPLASMMAIQNPGLESIAGNITERLKQMIHSL